MNNTQKPLQKTPECIAQGEALLRMAKQDKSPLLTIDCGQFKGPFTVQMLFKKDTHE